MNDRRTKRPIDADTARPRPAPAEKPKAATDWAIPVCLGEFGFEEARAFCPLWEATWSQDVRGRPGKK